MNILDQIIANKKTEIAKQKELISIDELIKSEKIAGKTLSLKNNLRQSKTGIIAEFKRKSPSKGWIFENAYALSITSGYSSAGASGISILTDEKYFGGTSADIISSREQVFCPILRKEFIVDEYQIYEAKAMGADLILLIAAALTPLECKNLARKARELNLEVLLEVHNEKELAHANEFVDMLGVNNRNLKNFAVDVQTSFDLAEKIPADFVKVSESGISDTKTVLELRDAGFEGFLMGENFMKEENPAQALREFVKCLELSEPRF